MTSCKYTDTDAYKKELQEYRDTIKFDEER